MAHDTARRFLVGTKKGLFVFERDGSAGWALARTAFLGSPVSMALHDRRDGALYAGLALGHFGPKLHRSDDGGASWQELAAPAFAKADAPQGGDDAKAPSVSLIWSLEAGGADQPGRLWAGTIPGGLFRSDDRGATWQLNAPLWNVPERAKWFGGGYDEPGIHSICVDPRDSRHVTISVSCGGVWRSHDDGASWTTSAAGMRAAFMPPERAYDETIQDPHRMVQCPAAPDHLWVQHHNGIFRSSDGARRWVEIENVAPSGFGFAVAVHPQDPQTAWFAPGVADEKRYPVDGRFLVNRTRDGGRTFTALQQGLPQSWSYDLVYRHGLDIAADGNALAIGSTTGNLWTSDDQGERWAAISTHLPPIACVRFA